MAHCESCDSPPYFQHLLVPTNHPICKAMLINQVLVDSVLRTNYLIIILTYHSQQHLTLQEKSDLALKLDQKLEQWKANLPNWLNPDTISFKDSEFASRQKLALQMRKISHFPDLHDFTHC
jgi:hypothetical protein